MKYKKTNKDKLIELALGGNLGSLLGTAGSLSGIPFLGEIGMQIGNNISNKTNDLKILQDHYNSLRTSTNPYQLADGGELTGDEDVAIYKGKEHSEGGIKVNSQGIPTNDAVAEVENEEVSFDIKGQKYIFSKRLKI